jgi:ribosomal protein L3
MFQFPQGAGSIGANTDPARCEGKKMPTYGSKKTTVKNLQIVKIIRIKICAHLRAVWKKRVSHSL